MEITETGLFKDKYNLEIKDFLRIVSFTGNFSDRSEQILKRYSAEGTFPDSTLFDYLSTVASMVTGRIINEDDIWMASQVRNFVDDKIDSFLQRNCTKDSFFKTGFREECFLHVIYKVKTGLERYNDKRLKGKTRMLLPEKEDMESLDIKEENVTEEKNVEDSGGNKKTNKTVVLPEEEKNLSTTISTDREANYNLPFHDFVEETYFSSEFIAQKTVEVLSLANESFRDKKNVEGFLPELANTALFLYNNTPSWFGLTAADICPLIYDSITEYISKGNEDKNLLPARFFDDCTQLVFNYMQKRKEVITRNMPSNNFFEEDVTDLEWEECVLKQPDNNLPSSGSDKSLSLTESEYQEKRNYLATVVSSITLNWEMTQNFMVDLDNIAIENCKDSSPLHINDLFNFIEGKVDLFLKQFVEKNPGTESMLPEEFHNDCVQMVIYKLQSKLQEYPSTVKDALTHPVEIAESISSLYKDMNESEIEEEMSSRAIWHHTNILSDNTPVEVQDISQEQETSIPGINENNNVLEELEEEISHIGSEIEFTVKEEESALLLPDEKVEADSQNITEEEVNLPINGEIIEPENEALLLQERFDLKLQDFLDIAVFDNSFKEKALKSLNAFSKLSRLSFDEIIKHLDSVSDSLVLDVVKNNKEWEIVDIWQYIENHSSLLATNSNSLEDKEKNSFHEGCFAYVIYQVKIKTGELLNDKSEKLDLQSIIDLPYGKYINEMPEVTRADRDELISELNLKEKLINSNFDCGHFVAYMDSLIPNIERVLDYPVYKISDVLTYINTSLDSYKTENVNACKGNIYIIFRYISLALKRILQQTGNGTTNGRPIGITWAIDESGSNDAIIDPITAGLVHKEEKKYKFASKAFYIIIAFIFLVLLLLFMAVVPGCGDKLLSHRETKNDTRASTITRIF